MRFRTSAPLAVFLALSAFVGTQMHASSCTTQSALSPADRAALANAGMRFGHAILDQNYDQLKADLFPAVVGDWDNIHAAIEQSLPLVKFATQPTGEPVTLRNVYLLDATSLVAPADTQFFCSNTDGSLTVTLFMRALPPGRYAVLFAATPGATYGGQITFILADDHGTWKLGGVSLRPGMLDSHDGRWYWTSARTLISADPWSAWLSYEAARLLLVPSDFLGSPNLDKLNSEQESIKNSPAASLPLTVTAGDRSWKITELHFDPSLLHADIDVVYESTGVTDPAAQRTEATAVLSAFLKAQPGLRAHFHGLWAVARRDGKLNPVLALPVEQIP